MARIAPLAAADCRELANVFEPLERRLGVVPNSLRTMARKPQLARAIAALGDVVHRPTSNVSTELRRLVGQVASQTAGCSYCIRLTSRPPVDSQPSTQEKLARACRFETDPCFSAAERVALRFASAAAESPNRVSDDLMAELRHHYGDDDILDLLAVVSYYGFMNRWNATLQTDHEDAPLGTAAPPPTLPGCEPEPVEGGHR
ncbi:MAG: carboxymuconolactone decarboxylase family protein [Myxococcales bacterium]|nr:carboxymuconolactone decarboxylase family protein [Myxococcales bacterium]MDD9967047.1 carboxymuconolactone decarboxylase family protein [Myxococcales bacterium]